jgi:hypothetical protein
VHVQHATGQAKFWLEPVVALAQNYGLGHRQISAAFRLLKENEDKIRAAWEAVEVRRVSLDGFWLRVEGRELFVAFSHFPWFENATIRQITAVERPSPHHLRWPDLDIDLALASIEHPERFPLVSRALAVAPVQPPRRRSGKARPPSRRPARD